MSQFAAVITELGDKIANLKVSEAVQLRDYLKEVYKIEPAAGSPMMATGPVGPVAPVEKPPDQTEFAVIIEAGYDAAKKIGIIKVVRMDLNCSHKLSSEWPHRYAL